MNMLFGQNNSPNAAPNTASNNAMIFDVTTHDFEEKVMKASMTQPIIVDFWAPWCGPCKQLMPVLEKIVGELGGAVSMAKVNIDDNPELAQALRVQSVPIVFAFFQGQPINAFQGVRPESEIKAFIAELLKEAKQAQPDALDIPQTLSSAAEALAQGDLSTAQNLYVQILQEDEASVEAFTGLVRTFIAADRLEEAAGMIENAPDDIAKDPQFQAAKTALELAQIAGDAGDLTPLEKAVSQKPNDLNAKFEYGMALFGAGRREEAVDLMVEIIAADREWEEDKARLQLLKFFEAMGPSDPASITGRRKLSRVLFS
jgi:putative thioredoxin